MLNWLRSIDWRSLAASALFLGAVVLAIHALGIDSPPYQENYPASEEEPAQESVQDIAAETVAHYTKMLAWFTAVLAIGSLAQNYFLLRADQTARMTLWKVPMTPRL